jgi:hypothetical protein
MFRGIWLVFIVVFQCKSFYIIRLWTS